ncbi:MAG: hypothetical protein P8R42_26120 [Candidatus Binatia bacterium]|nr:hypothetical protein [Candidatus Binatia bacterium]
MEPLSNLDRVAGRLNRLALQRAIYRTLGLALLSAALLAPAALWLSGSTFLAVFAGLVALCLGVATGSFWTLRSHWAKRAEAARWVEHEVDLDERLLTLVSAPDELRKTPLWAELETDNAQHLDDWQNEKLNIPAVPANVILLAVGLIVAILALAPGGGDADLPPPPPSFLADAEEPPLRSGAVPVPGTAKAAGELSGDGVTEEGDAPGMAASNLTAVKAQLGERFAKSFVASQLGGGGQKEESDGEEATGMRGDLPESDMGDSNNNEGGMTPPEGLGHIVQDDADDGGQTVRRFEAEGGGGTTGSSQGGVRKGEAPEQGEASGSPSESDGEESERDPDAPVMVSEDDTKMVPGSGGSGPGDMPGTGPLLAGSPLDLSGGRRVARFSLALGAMSDTDPNGEGGTIDSDVYSHIAEGERGEQESDAGVRHESIPPEYETVIKRVFERNT